MNNFFTKLIATAFIVSAMSLAVKAEHGPIITNSTNALISNQHIEWSSESTNIFEELASVTFNMESEKLNLKTLINVDFIQLINAQGNLEFQMPIMSDNIHLSLGEFESGLYQLNILFAGMDSYQSSELTIK